MQILERNQDSGFWIHHNMDLWCISCKGARFWLHHGGKVGGPESWVHFLERTRGSGSAIADTVVWILGTSRVRIGQQDPGSGSVGTALSLGLQEESQAAAPAGVRPAPPRSAPRPPPPPEAGSAQTMARDPRLSTAPEARPAR